MEGKEHMLTWIEKHETRAIGRLVSPLGGVVVDELVGPAPEVTDGLSFFFDGVCVGLMEVGEDGEVSVLPLWELGPESA